MTVKCQEIISSLEKLAPKYLAEEWDNAGLQVGAYNSDVSRILIALDLTEAVLDEAEQQQVDCIIVHHPAIFKPLKQIRTDLPLGRMLARAIRSHITVYAAHTNLDSADGGINDCLAMMLEVRDAVPLAPSFEEKLLKLVVFVPEGHEDIVRTAIAEAGAGALGNYKYCTFQASGLGTFKPLSGAEPFIGTVGQIEKVHEYRIETIVPEHMSRKVIAAMLKAHPYEEVAYDLYPLSIKGKQYGLGRVGALASTLTLEHFAAKISKALAAHVRVVGELNKPIKKVAVCGGSGADLIAKAVFAGADVLVTGDVKYHQAQQALSEGMAIIDAGHFATENIIIPVLADYLRQVARDKKWDVDILTSSCQKDIFLNFTHISEEPVIHSSTQELKNIVTAQKVTIFTDGGSRGNPGPAGIGVAIYQDDVKIDEIAEYIGITTNNVAEYKAMLNGLEKCLEMGVKSVVVKADSELLVKQINGLYKVKNEGLIPLFEQAKQLLKQFDQYKVLHIPREQNKVADALANKAMDQAK